MWPSLTGNTGKNRAKTLDARYHTKTVAYCTVPDKEKRAVQFKIYIRKRCWPRIAGTSKS